MNVETRLRARKMMTEKGFFVFVLFFLEVLIITVLNFAPGVIDSMIFTEEHVPIAIRATLSVVMLFVFFSFYSLLSLGADEYFMLNSDSAKKATASLFHFFKPSLVLRSVKLLLLLFFTELAAAFVCFLPSVIPALYFITVLKNGCSVEIAYVLFAGCVMLLICSCFFYFKFKRLLFLSKYLYISNSGFKALQYVRTSIILMNKFSGRIFRLRLSFAGWIALCFFILPIPYTYVYYKQTMAIAAGSIIKSNAE